MRRSMHCVIALKAFDTKNGNADGTRKESETPMTSERSDDQVVYQGKKGWVCPICRQARRADGCDPCIPNLPGVMYACCGHGGTGPTSGYIHFENGVRIGMIVTDISYDDDRSRIDVPAHA